MHYLRSQINILVHSLCCWESLKSVNAELVGSHVSEHMKVLLVLAVGY